MAEEGTKLVQLCGGHFGAGFVALEQAITPPFHHDDARIESV